MAMLALFEHGAVMKRRNKDSPWCSWPLRLKRGNLRKTAGVLSEKNTQEICVKKVAVRVAELLKAD
jgi:hypothetical protein